MLRLMSIMSVPAKPFRLVALDLDGTTLNAKHRIADATLEVLRRLSSQGVTIAICTGRASDSVFDYAKTLALPQAHLPMVVFNGSVCLLYDNKTGEHQTLFSKLIEPHASKPLVALAAEQGHVIQLYNAETAEVYASPKTPLHTELLLRYEHLVERRQVMVSDYDVDVYAQRCSCFAKMLVLTYEPDQFMEVCRERLPQGSLHMIRGSPDPFFCEFLLPESNKGTALASLCDHLGIPLDQAMAFGDGENDIEMLTAAGLGVAMSNARPSVKAAANVVTEHSNDDDGVARQLISFEQSGYFGARE